jgi:L-ribulokinase
MSMSSPLTIGLDFGTNAMRAVVVDAADGTEVGSASFSYPHGAMGVLEDPRNPHQARQHPADYLAGIRSAVPEALRQAGPDADRRVVGLGVDATGSTPIPLDEAGEALALRAEFADNPQAMAWLWKDHTAIAEAAEITARARAERPAYLAKCGGAYSSEWFWAKLLKCSRSDPAAFRAAATWAECSDWIPAVLTGTAGPGSIRRNVCAAGHKAMFHSSWGGYPDPEFLGSFDRGALVRVRETLPDETVVISTSVGGLTAAWAGELGLPEGLPVAAGALDAHMGAVGSGIRPGTMVQVVGTSSCVLAVAPLEKAPADPPGVCGVVPESILPGCLGIEAGQSAVGDIFNWFVHTLRPGGGMDHAALNRAAAEMNPGESGLLALDWHNGNRTVLMDPRLTGLLVGLTLHSTPAEIYRALIEATAFGARVIRDRLAEYAIPIERVINCGGIARKSPLAMQIYADVLNCPMLISAADETCALGSAMAGAVAAGIYPDFDEAARAMTGVREERFEPMPDHVAVYDELFALYQRLHDLFGTRESAGSQADVMKRLLDLRDRQRG